VRTQRKSASGQAKGALGFYNPDQRQRPASGFGVHDNHNMKEVLDSVDGRLEVRSEYSALVSEFPPEGGGVAMGRRLDWAVSGPAPALRPSRQRHLS
jgi:hypothetical protein